jgi:hypothetical protein
MPIGWITALKAVPWTEVIANAPQIANGAKQLWTRLRKTPAPQPAPASGPTGAEASIAALEQSLSEAHAQLQESARLISSLAEQNTQLIAKIEFVRQRQLGILWIAIIAAVLAVAALAVVVQKP